jgi:hypothetical protein
MLHEQKAMPNEIKIIVIFLKWIIAIARSIYVSYKNFYIFFFYIGCLIKITEDENGKIGRHAGKLKTQQY